MNATGQRILAFLLIVFGLFIGSGYAVLVALAESRRDATDEWGTLAGFGLFSGMIGVFWLLLTFNDRSTLFPAFRLPPVWLSLFVFMLLVGAGFGLQIADRATYLAPLLAVLAFGAVGAFFLRVAARWMPGNTLTIRNIVWPGIWGIFIAPILLIALQGGAVVMMALGLVAGIVADNPDFELDPNLDERISNYLEGSDTGATSTELPKVVETPTVALMLFSLVAVIAPLSEELIKAVGAIFVLSSRPAVSRVDAFQVAVAAGLGFAIFEGIGYTLAAPSSWHQLILIRAPVVIMHVAATTIVVLGWYRMRETGRGFLPYFAAGVILHAGWNALAVGFVYSLTGIESGSDPSAAQALAIFAVVLILGALFFLAVGWFISAARKAGEGVEPAPPEYGPAGPAAASPGAILGSG